MTAVRCIHRAAALPLELADASRSEAQIAAALVLRCGICFLWLRIPACGAGTAATAWWQDCILLACGCRRAEL